MARRRSLYPRPHWLLGFALCLVMLVVFHSTGSAHVGRHGAQDKHSHPAPPPLTEEQLKRRYEKIKQRAANRKRTRRVRARDRRRALQNRLKRLLRGAPMSAAIKTELALHAKRVAQLRRIRLVAAEAADKNVVLRVDNVLALENQRHERWWRTFRETRRKQNQAKARRK